MDDGCVLTIQQKRSILGTLAVLAILLIVDLALWFFLGKLKLLFWIALGLGVLLAALGLSVAVVVIFRSCTAGYTVTGKQKIKRRLACLLLLILLGVCYFMYPQLSDIAAIVGQIKQDVENTGQNQEQILPDVSICLPAIQVGFWHVLFILVGIGVVIAAFFSGFLRGILAIPAVLGYEILFLGACSGYFVRDSAIFMKLIAAALFVLLITGLILRSWGGFALLLSLVRFLVPLTLLAVIAVWLQMQNPATASPVNFRAVYNWIILLTMFAAQTVQLVMDGFDGFDSGSGEDDNLIAHMTGDEMTGALDIFD